MPATQAQREENTRRAIEKHAERLTRQPHPATGKPVESNAAYKHAQEIARNIERKQGGKR